MVEPEYYDFETLSLHAGTPPDPTTGARAQPIYMTTSYVFEDTDHAAALFNLERPGHIYSRISNPTVAAFEERVAALEGGVVAVATASGQAALHLAIATLIGQGGHIVASRNIYGGSVNLLTHTLPRFGISTSFIDPNDVGAFEEAITDDTQLVFVESLGNPRLDIVDLPAVSEIAHGAGVPVLVDNTFATPYLFRPFEWGADLVYHSATKFLGGHGVAIGGVVVDSGRFDWEASGRFPTLTEPYAGYHGIDFAEEYGRAAFSARARAEGLRDFGAAMSPQNAFYLLQGIETLPVRMARHVDNARAVIDFLRQSEHVDWVSYPEIPDHQSHDLAATMFPLGCGAIFSFGIHGGREAGKKFIEALRVFSHLANVGDAKSLVIHPGSTTHQQMTSTELAEAGIGEELIRLSVGLESADDLLSDLAQALRASRQ